MTYDIIIFTDNASRYSHIKSLGAYRLASELRDNGYSVKIVDFICKIITNKLLFETLLKGLIGPNTLFVGWSSNFFGDYPTDDRSDHADGNRVSKNHYNYPTDAGAFSYWVKYIKKLNSSVKIVYGGAKAHENADLVDDIDYVVVGLADASVVDLANHLRHNTSLKWKPSFNHKWKIIDYDKLGASFNFASSLTKLTEADHIFENEVLTLETSRGCMFKCKFCGYPLLGRKKSNPAYHRTQECLTEELLYNWDKFKTTRYIIVDDTFNETASKLETLLKARDAAKIDLELTAYLRIDLIHRFPEQMKLLKDLGVKAGFFGVESFNDKSASLIGKGLPSAAVKDMLYQVKDNFGPEFCSQIGIICGLPLETPETFANGMDWMLAKDSPVDSYRINPLYIGPSIYPSEFSLEYEKYGYTRTNDGRDWVNDIWNSTIVANITDEYHRIGHYSGKQKLGNFELFAFLNYGYELSDLKDIPNKDLDWKKFRHQLIDYYSKYITTLLDYENISYNGKL